MQNKFIVLATASLLSGGAFAAADAVTASGGIATEFNTTTSFQTTIGNQSGGASTAIYGDRVVIIGTTTAPLATDPVTISLIGNTDVRGVLTINSVPLLTATDLTAGMSGKVDAAGGTLTNGTVSGGTVMVDSVATTNAYLGGNATNAAVTITPTSVSMNGNRIQNVGNGINATDAVNKSQLDQVSSRVDQLSSRVDENQKEARRGIASIAAVAGIPALESGKRFNMGVGLGSFKGESALAVGGHVRMSDALTAKLAVGASNSDASVSVGFGYSF